MTRKSKIIVAATALVLVAVIVFYALVDPTEADFMPRCMLKALTGYDCPGCGIQRAAHALLHGRVAEAFGYNALAFVLIPVGLLYFVVEIMPERCARLRTLMLSPRMLVALIIIIMCWWVVRNLIGI